MNYIKILHCADLHIGALESFLGSRAESRRAEALLTFEKIITTAKNSGVKLILIAGDLINSNRIEQSFITRILDGLSSISNIHIVYAAGNHDPLNFESPFLKTRLPENLHILSANDDCITLNDLGVRVYGFSFSEVYKKGSDKFSIVPPEDDFINLMCIHGELRSDLGSDYNSITESFIRESGMDYIALGHIHKRTSIAKIGNTYCAYCGCPEGQGFDELGEKGVYIGDVSKSECNLKFVPISKRLHLCEKIDISQCLSSAQVATVILEKLKEKFGETYTDNLYKIILTGNIDDGVEISVPEITARLSEVVYFAKVRNESEVAANLSVLANEASLRGIFVKKMLEKLENAESDDQKADIKYALNLGLKAFKSEVFFDENQ